MLNPGDLVEAWDWPEVEQLVWGVRKRATVRGKVKLVENGSVHIWAQHYAGMWSHLRIIPTEFVISRDTKTDDDRRERERVRLRRKREAYAALGVKAS